MLRRPRELSIEVGKQADLVVLNAGNSMYIPYKFGTPSLIDMVIKNGEIVAANAPALASLIHVQIRLLRINSAQVFISGDNSRSSDNFGMTFRIF